MKRSFLEDLVMNQELGREELEREIWVSVDDSGILWVD
jgi:hypothetical protein